jgi:UDP-N-acetylmuramoylalanine--D-glutamate ligase
MSSDTPILTRVDPSAPKIPLPPELRKSAQDAALKPFVVSGRAFSVVGAGKSGLAAANLLARHGADVALFEQRPIDRPESLDPRVTFVANSNGIRRGDVAVLSPGLAEVSPIRADIASQASEVIGEIELFYRLCPAPILAITGTDGKSTVTTMLGDIVLAAGHPTFVGGNLGNPLCDDLDHLTAEHIVVAEVSCFQLTTCHDFRPRVAVVTNIAEDHTDYHGSFPAYQAAKRLIWRAQTERDVLVINGDDPNIATWSLPSGPEAPKIRRFSLRDPDADARVVPSPTGHRSHDRLEVTHPSGERFYIMMRAELPLLGDHNVGNALAAAQMAVDSGINPEAIRAALSAYRPLPHRLAKVAVIDGITWVDDSKATSPNAATAGLSAIDGPVILLLGGSSKDADFHPFAEVVRRRARHVICFGQTRHTIAEALGSHPHDVVETMPEAIEIASKIATRGDTVLLSPACASFDQFKGYAHRGEVFTSLVMSLRTHS